MGIEQKLDDYIEKSTRFQLAVVSDLSVLKERTSRTETALDSHVAQHTASLEKKVEEHPAQEFNRWQFVVVSFLSLAGLALSIIALFREVPVHP